MVDTSAKQKHRECLFAIEALMLALIFMVAVYFACGMWFETNDDVFIAEVLAGKVTGSIDYHNNTNTSVFLTMPMALLYSISTNIPWWGLMLFLNLLVVTFCIIYFSLLRTKSMFQHLISLTISLSVLLLGIHNYGQFQYTGCALLLAFTGYYVLLLDDNPKRSIGLFAIFEFASCVLRDKSMMIAQPVGFSVVMAYLIFLKPPFTKEKFASAFKRLAVCFALVIVSIGIVKGARLLTYSGAEWEEYKKADIVREYLVDYEGEVSYSQLENILEKHGISEEEYNQFLEYRIWYPDYKFTIALYDELIPVLKEMRSRDNDTDVWFASIEALLFASGQFWHMHQVTFALFLTAVLLGILLNAKKQLVGVCGGLCGYLFSLVLLAIRNRYELRVMLPFYLGAVLLLSGLIIMMIAEATESISIEPKIRVRTLLSVTSVTLCYIFVALCIGRVQFAYVRRQNSVVNPTEYDIMMDIANYCNANPDKAFLVDNSYARSISTDVFDTEYYQKVNFIYSGSWFETAESMVRHAKEYLGKDDVYFLVYEAQEFKGLEALEFYEMESGREASLCEKFKIRSGATIWVYRL